MSHIRTMTLALAVMIVAVSATSVRWVNAQNQASNDLPNLYRTIENRFNLPGGRNWGAISAVDIDKDGRSIWVAERCGGNSGCLANPTVDPIVLFDPSGKLIRSFGAGLIVSPHGIYLDREGNVWVTDYQDDARGNRGGAPGVGVGRGRGAIRGAAGAADGPPVAPPAGRGPGGPVGAAAGATKGHQVFKFSPDGKLLLTLGMAGGSNDVGYFYQPNDVLVAPNGDIFVSQGHNAGGRILKFDKTGRFIKQFGRNGSGPGEFNVPHALAMDSKGRLFVGDRANNRIQIFDQEGQFLEEWKQFGRPSGLFIDKNDILYVADSESGDARNPDFKRGIRIGSVRDGKVTALIPDPWTADPRPATTSPEGVAVDGAGNIYGVEVTETDVKVYVRK